MGAQALYSPFFTALLIASLFYAIVPVLGAFSIRSSWRRFRSRLQLALSLPYLGYKTVHDDDSDGFLGAFRFFGELEAAGNPGRFWLKGRGIGSAGRVTVSVDMRDALIYAIPGYGRMESPFPAGVLPDLSSADPPESISWRSLSYLDEGLKVFVSGSLHREAGRATYRGTRKDPLVILFYESDDESLLVRAIQLGRQKNEYWNRMTPVSLAFGALLMSILLLSLPTRPMHPSVMLLTALAAFLPLSVFLPPGVFLLLLYRFAWKRAREIRAARDISRLPEYFPGGSDAMGRFASPPEDPHGTMNMHWQPLALRIVRAGGWSVYRSRDPHDPMVSSSIIPGEPGAYARACAWIARAWTILAVLCVLAACAINNVMIYMMIFTVLSPGR